MDFNVCVQSHKYRTTEEKGSKRPGSEVNTETNWSHDRHIKTSAG